MNSIDDKLFNKFKEIAKNLYLLQKDLLNEIDLSNSFCKIISVLSTQKELTQTALSCICGFDKPATSRLIEKMQKEDFLIKFFKENNKKNTYLKLTEKGLNKAKQIKNTLNNLKQKYFNPLSEKDKELCYEILDRSIININGGCEC